MGLEAMLFLEGLLNYHTLTSFLSLRQLGSDVIFDGLLTSHIYIFYPSGSRSSSGEDVQGQWG